MRTHSWIRLPWALWTTAVLVLGSLVSGPSAAAQTSPVWTASGLRVGTRDASGAVTPFTINGINWYGFETRSYVVHGLYAQDYHFIVDEIRKYGYNTIRLPFSNQMWETNPVPNPNTISACPECKQLKLHSRDIMADIVNYAGSQGLHVILENHRSEAGNGSEDNGLWYTTAGGTNYPESAWVSDWVSVLRWANGQRQTTGSTDTVTVNYLASDGKPIVIGFDLRNEPHTPSRTPYLQGATWGTGDGIDPAANPNPNPFSPGCVVSSSCHDWRLAAERAGDTILGEAAARGWAFPLVFVQGIGQYPTASGTAASGPYDFYWWGGQLQGVNGNANNPGAPIVFDRGGTASSLGPAVANQLVYSVHDFGPSLFKQGWFNASTCYTTGCSSSSLADVWHNHWGYLTQEGGISPVWPGHTGYPWSNTGSAAYGQAPVIISEFGTGNSSGDLSFSGNGSQGQWFTDLVNFVQSSYSRTAQNDPGFANPVAFLNWTYWALNTEDSFALLGSSYNGLANPTKEYSFLCMIQQPSASGCGSTGPLPPPDPAPAQPASDSP